MKELANNILAQIEVDISEIDLYGYNIIDVSLSIVHRLQTALNDLRMKIQTYIYQRGRNFIFQNSETGNTRSVAILL